MPWRNTGERTASVGQTGTESAPPSPPAEIRRRIRTQGGPVLTDQPAVVDEESSQADGEHGGREEEEEDVELCLSVREFVLEVKDRRRQTSGSPPGPRGVRRGIGPRYNAATAASLTGYSRLVPGTPSDGNALYLRPGGEDQTPQRDYE